MSSPKRTTKFASSVYSVDYELTDSEDDKPNQDDFEIVIARDNVLLQETPERSDLSDCKTSDVTKVTQVRDISGIHHEPQTQSVTASHHSLLNRSAVRGDDLG